MASFKEFTHWAEAPTSATRDRRPPAGMVTTPVKGVPEKAGEAIGANACCRTDGRACSPGGEDPPASAKGTSGSPEPGGFFGRA
jgi:hypothetical protein